MVPGLPGHPLKELALRGQAGQEQAIVSSLGPAVHLAPGLSAVGLLPQGEIHLDVLPVLSGVGQGLGHSGPVLVTQQGEKVVLLSRALPDPCLQQAAEIGGAVGQAESVSLCFIHGQTAVDGLYNFLHLTNHVLSSRFCFPQHKTQRAGSLGSNRLRSLSFFNF